MLGRLDFGGRLVAIALLSSLAIAAALGLIGSFLQWQRVETDGWVSLPQRAAAFVALMDGADETRQALLLQAFNSESVAVSRVPQRPVISTASPRLPAVEWLVGQFMPAGRKHEVIAIKREVEPTFWNSFRLGQLRAFAREPLQVSVSLNDEHWVVFETRVDISPSVLGFPPGLVIGTIGALVGIFALLAIAREAQPLRDLASAVSAFGADARPRTVEPRGAPEFKALIGSVNEMQSRMAALFKGRTMMLGAVSHDLKTYITRLRLRVEAMPDEESHAKATRDLDDMTALIDDALAIAKGGTISDRCQRVDIAALLASDLPERPSVTLRRTSTASKGAPVIDGDPAALRRLFDNVLNNACQYATHVAVTVNVRNGHVLVSVDDNGPGIPETERLAVFEPFYRLDQSRSRSTGGSGLGLAIAKQIANAHGGTISIDASPMGGARATIELPKAIEIQDQKQRDDRQSAGSPDL